MRGDIEAFFMCLAVIFILGLAICLMNLFYEGDDDGWF